MALNSLSVAQSSQDDGGKGKTKNDNNDNNNKGSNANLSKNYLSQTKLLVCFEQVKGT